MLKLNFSRANGLASGNDARIERERFPSRVRRTTLSILAVLLILAAIGANTLLAVRQADEQKNAMRALQSSSRLKQDLDQLQQMMLDEHGELYTLISTKSFYPRSPYTFPLRELGELTNDARDACKRRSTCLSELDDLDGMIRLLGARSDALFQRATQHPGSVGLGDAQLSEIDAYFYSVLEHVVEVRMQADATMDTTVSQSSNDAKWVSNALLFCALVASLLLLALIYRNARIAHKLRVALREADNTQVALRLQGRALQASINGIIIAEARGEQHIIMFANAAFERISGYGEEDVLNADCEALFSLNGEPDKWDVVRKALADDSEANATLLCSTKDGKRFWNNILVAPVRDDHGRVTHHIGVMSDVSALVEYQQRLEHQARYDALTELPNRTLLDERLAEAIHRASGTDGQVSVLFLDLDRFKEVNDSLGHRVGDALLARVAKRLQRLVRATDLVARYGGDEFIIVAERSNAEQLVPMLDRLVASMSEPFHMGVQELYVEASIGVSTYPQDGPDADTLIRNADAAMYLAKSHGRNGYKFYRAELNVAAAERLQLSTRLRRAVKAQALEIAYQPQIDMLTGHVFGAEALLRWKDPELGVVSPATFIPVAEESGMIQVIGEWVLRTACAQARAWLDQGLPPIRVSVNVSPLQLERSDLVAVVKSALHDAQLPADRLELEVTEGALMRNADDVARTLRELRNLGVKIAIDDFGTGYSSLSYLKRFSVDRIKIDRAFVRDIGKDGEFEALTLAVIGIAKALKFDVLAEGVELDVHRRFLIEHGCTEGQGFLYSPAIAGDRFAEMLGKTEKTDNANVAETEVITR